MSGTRHHTVTLEADMTEPALVPAAFDLLRLNAQACGLEDVGRIYIHLKIEVEGLCYERQVEELSERLGILWLGDVTGVKVKDCASPESPAS